MPLDRPPSWTRSSNTTAIAKRSSSGSNFAGWRRIPSPSSGAPTTCSRSSGPACPRPTWDPRSSSAATSTWRTSALTGQRTGTSFTTSTTSTKPSWRHAASTSCGARPASCSPPRPGSKPRSRPCETCWRFSTDTGRRSPSRSGPGTSGRWLSAPRAGQSGAC